jgi:hypothetical protein
MTLYHGTGARFYYHTMDLSGYAEQVEQQLNRSVAEYPPLNATAVERLAGHRDARITLTGGALKTIAGGNDEYVWTRLGEEVRRPWAFLPRGDAVGRPAYCGLAVGENQQRTAGDDIVRLPVAMVSTDEIDRCAILRALAAGGASPGPTYDSAIVGGSAAGGGAYLLCTAISGVDAELTVTFEDSANGVDWATLVAMTALTAVGSEVKEVTGAVRQYLRVSWTLTGTGPAATWFAAFGRR